MDADQQLASKDCYETPELFAYGNIEELTLGIGVEIGSGQPG